MRCCCVKRIAEWRGLWQTGQRMPVWWGQLPHSSGYLYWKGWGTSIAIPSDSSREGRNVDFYIKSFNGSVDNWFILQIRCRCTPCGQCLISLAFSKPTDLCLENIPPSGIEINYRAPEVGRVCLCRSPALPQSSTVSVYLEYRDQRTFLSGELFLFFPISSLLDGMCCRGGLTVPLDTTPRTLWGASNKKEVSPAEVTMLWDIAAPLCWQLTPT